MRHFFIELYQRLGAHTPPFFKKMMGVLASLAATSAALLAAGEYLPAWLNPEWLKSAIALSAGGIFVCKTAINWNKTSPDDVPAVPAPAAVQVVKQEFDLPADKDEQPT